MKKILLYIILGTISFTSCKRDNDDSGVEEVVSVETQNSYDDLAAQKFLKDNYFDPQGKVTAYSPTDPTDDNYPSLFTYNPVTLPSGVVVVTRPSAQPTPGKTINEKDVLRLTSESFAYIAKNLASETQFSAKQTFRNSLSSGTPEVDPFYFYVKNSQLNGESRSFYEIEGFQEGIKYFKSCEIPDVNNYNMQGVIIVPSRAAFARDKNALEIINGTYYKFADRSFVFNVQVYKTDTRLATEF